MAIAVLRNRLWRRGNGDEGVGVLVGSRRSLVLLTPEVGESEN